MARLIAGAVNDEQYLDPKSIEVKGSLDSTGVDNKSSANLIFNDNISAYIETSINEELQNNLIIKSDKVDLKGLINRNDKYGEYAWSVLEKIIKYASSLVPEITKEFNDCLLYTSPSPRDS